MIEFKDFVFYVLSFVLISSGLSVITSRNPVTAALSLVLAFFNAAGIWLLLQAEFLAIEHKMTSGFSIWLLVRTLWSDMRCPMLKFYSQRMSESSKG